MEKRAISKFVRVSAFKAREVARLIQGKPAVEALAICKFSPRKSADLIGKALASAVANAENDAKNPVPRVNLYVKEAVVGEGPTMRRIQYKSRGRAGRIRKRSSHIRIVVSDEI
ncbi:MAG: 50S ribosomal protein L22 [Lentisphaeria bacterium]|nr:50S ribosomal protein L22 [Lentisphaeria bacterium]